MKKLLLALLLTGLATAWAQDPLVFDSKEQEARFTALAEELRCMVCQNQSLADSDAPLARDLRNEIYDMLRQGNSDEEIKKFLVDRYGDFVLYEPPVQGNTVVLWLAPMILLGIGAAVIGFNIRKRSALLAEEDLADGDNRPDGNETTS